MTPPGPVKAFLAYPSQPPVLGESQEEAAKELNRAREVEIASWTSLSVGGRAVIQAILKEIDARPLLLADLTGLNPNVLFEVGYGIATDRRMWFSIQTAIDDAIRLMEQLGLLTTFGYAEYKNHQDLVGRFYADRPNEALEQTIFNESIKPSLPPDDTSHLLFLKLNHDDEASLRVTKRVQRSIIPRILDDPSEGSRQWLSWYGSKVYTAAGVLCHLAPPTYKDATVHNARLALVAGLARGFRRPLLMLRSGDDLGPLDYRELLVSYQSTAQAEKAVDAWLNPLEAEWALRSAKRQNRRAARTLATELRGLNLGEHIAENEDPEALDDYFIETGAYRTALRGQSLIFAGRKGTGKTANLLRLERELAEDTSVLVCTIKPPAYEIKALVQLMEQVQGGAGEDYVVEGLWKLMLTTEIAGGVYAHVKSSPQPSAAEQQLCTIMERHDGELLQDFSIRLERCVTRLLAALETIEIDSGVESFRAALTEALHTDTLSELRLALGRALDRKKRVAVLIDNLDKAWDRHHDLERLSAVLLGLLSAAGRVQTQLARESSRLVPVKVSLAIFLRSDILHRLKSVAREPDKLTSFEMRWDDDEMLRRVVEERYRSNRDEATDPEELWTRFFCEKVEGLPTKEYLLRQIMPRPRDLVFLVNSAISWAINRGHPTVEPADIEKAQEAYSLFAVESLLVENGVSAASIKQVVEEFYLAPEPVMTVDEARVRVGRVAPAENVETVLRHLAGLGFFGIETSPATFRYAESPDELDRLMTLNQRASLETGSNRLCINRPFWSYLDIGKQ